MPRPKTKNASGKILLMLVCGFIIHAAKAMAHDLI